jgi:hypothetical protein
MRIQHILYVLLLFTIIACSKDSVDPDMPLIDDEPSINLTSDLVGIYDGIIKLEDTSGRLEAYNLFADIKIERKDNNTVSLYISAGQYPNFKENLCAIDVNVNIIGDKAELKQALKHQPKLAKYIDVLKLSGYCCPST